MSGRPEPPRSNRHHDGRSRRSPEPAQRAAPESAPPRDGSRGRSDAPMAREVAANVVRRVLSDGGFSQLVLAGELDRSRLEGRDRAFAAALAYATLTWRTPIDAELNARLPRGLSSLPDEVAARLRVAVAQIGFMGQRVPAWAARSEAVNATQGALRGLVDAVLRRVAEGPISRPGLEATVARFGWDHGLPDWIAARLLDRLGPDESAEVMRAFNAPTPTHLRVRRGTVEDAIAALAFGAAGDGSDPVDVVPHPLIDGALIAPDGRVLASEAHRSGRVAVQDGGAQVAAQLFPDGCARVLDVCAGLGGKTLHLVDRFGAGAVTATDRDLRKLLRIRDIPGGQDVAVVAWDVEKPVPELLADRGPFDAVLLDAPCSALGTLGRHPEVRHNRGPELVGAMARIQATALEAIAPLVAPGGWLVYVVCTFTPEETTERIDAFCAAHPDFVMAGPAAGSAPASRLVDDRGQVALWPHRHATDGFFMARLRRTEEPAR